MNARTPMSAAGPYSVVNGKIFKDGATAREEVQLGKVRSLCNAHDALVAALAGIIWKLERKESANGTGSDCVWAKIDFNDATVRAARAVLTRATHGSDSK